MKIIKNTMVSLIIILLTGSITACGNKAESYESQDDSLVTARYMVGDIILADGTVIKAADLTGIKEENLPVAVIADSKEDGTALGVGVHRSSAPLQWASEERVKSADELTDDVEAYPAVDFVNAYGEQYKLPVYFQSGWYMPSIAELYTIYQNRESINDSLQAIYQWNAEASMDGLDTNWYWASSQSEADDDYAWFIHFFNGYAGECPKNFTNVHVLAVRTCSGDDV